jgi:NTE family protein
MLEHRNQLAEAAAKLEIAAQRTGDDQMRLSGPTFRHIPLPTVIAPEQIMPLDWIVDYEDANHKKLFAMGRADAVRALAQR